MLIKGIAFFMLLAFCINANADDVPPINGQSSPYSIFWGDVHTHSIVSSDFCPDGPQDPRCPGFKGVRYLFEQAEASDLDFVILTDHAEDISPGEWIDTLSIATQTASRGKIIPFVGFELAGTSPAVNLVFPQLAGEVLAEDVYKGQGRDRPDISMIPRDLIWQRLSRYIPFGLVAHPSNRDFVNEVGPIERKALVGVEFYSTGGRTHEPCSGGQSNNCSTYDNSIGAVAAGHMLAAVGGGNNHFALPGHDGLVGVLALGRTREHLVAALKARRTYAVRAERVLISFMIDGQSMGADFRKTPVNSDVCELTLSIAAMPDNRQIRGLVVARVDVNPEHEIGIDRKNLEATFHATLKRGETGIYLGRVLLEGFNHAEAVTSPIRVECGE